MECANKPARYNAPLMRYPPEIRRALRIIILAQCAGLIGPLLISNGFMLAYVLRLGVPAYRVLFLFALPPLIGMLLTLPFARLADRAGKRRLGGSGLALSIAGFMLFPLAAWMPGTTAGWLTAGILIFAVGSTANAASWFALLSPIVPVEIRGRWFGQMRTAWQTVSILFSIGVAALLRHHPSTAVFQIVLLVAGLLIFVRLALYMQIPELEPAGPPREGFFRTMAGILRCPGYLRFCVYIFLLTFVTGGTALLGLLQKQVLDFSDSRIVIMGNLAALGTIAGFYAGGRMVDRAGSRPVFLAGHFVFALTMAGILLRGWIPLPAAVSFGVFSFVCGAVQGATGIANTSELLALIPPENKSLSTGFCITLSAAGGTLSGMLSGQLLKTGVLPAQWSFLDQTLSAFDVMIAGFGTLALLMAASLGLVPKIRHLRHQWFPQNR